MGTLARTLVSRADIDMDEIRRVFKEKYEKELGDVICESIPCGDYRDFLVSWLQDLLPLITSITISKGTC
jgi:hypothetical protein